jgi:DNA-binding protein H-NS
MSKSYPAMLEEIRLLRAHAQAMRHREALAVVARIKRAVTACSSVMASILAGADIGRDGLRPSAARSSLHAPDRFGDRYGRRWSGRGRRPVWLREALRNGGSLDDFRL